jgi:hypothetical protein
VCIIKKKPKQRDEIDDSAKALFNAYKKATEIKKEESEQIGSQ